jgi:RNA 3'-terminal phosphate cyclase (ATP)
VAEKRGALLEVRGVSGSCRLKGEVGARQARAVQERLWEARRLESTWEVVEPPSASPGSFLLVEGVFEEGRCAFGFIGQRGVRAEVLGERAARTLLRFLDAEGAVDPHLADQLALPMALSGRGGRVSTSEVSLHLETVAEVVSAFGIPARALGRRGGPGLLEVAPA